MIRLILPLTVALTLSACAHKPVAVTPTPVQMPALPAPLNQRAQPLPPLVATDLHGMIRESISTDRAYNELRDLHNATLDAWTCVRTALNEQTDATACFKDALQ